MGERTVGLPRAADDLVYMAGGEAAAEQMSRMSLRTITNWLEIWSSEPRLALRTALAGLITFIVGHVRALPQG